MNFDTPGRTMCVTQRQNSNTPLQALNLLNDPVFFEAAQALAVEVLEGRMEWGKRLDLAFRLALSRPPSNLEQHRLERYFATQKAVFAKEPDSVSKVAGMAPVSVEPVEAATWVALCRTLINLNEFMTRE